MEAVNHSYKRKKENSRGQSGHEYISGSAVRQIQPEFLEEEEWELSGQEQEQIRKREREIQRRNAQIRRNQEKALQMTPGFICFIAVAAVVVLVLAVNYLQVQSTSVSLLNQIESTEEELGNLKADNALLERQLQTYVDLDHIYDVAVNELGMVHPSEDQVIYYSQVESEYVRQYDEIPR
jgi:cell division protein FtsL